MRSIPGLMACIVSVISVSPFAAEPSFWVSGKIVSEVAPRSEIRTFTVAVSEGAYHIQVLFPDNSSVPSLDVVFDGTNMVSSVRFKDSINHDSAVTIQKDFIPTSSLSAFVGELWLAFASFKYFETNKFDVRPVWHIGGPSGPLNRQIKYKANRELQTESPFLPTSIDFISDGVIPYTRDETFGKIDKWPGPYDEGFVTARYQVQQVTNIGGYKLPQKFTFEQFEPRPDLNRQFRLKSLSRRIFWVEEGGTVVKIPSAKNLYGERTLVTERDAEGKVKNSELQW